MKVFCNFSKCQVGGWMKVLCNFSFVKWMDEGSL